MRRNRLSLEERLAACGVRVVVETVPGSRRLKTRLETGGRGGPGEAMDWPGLRFCRGPGGHGVSLNTAWQICRRLEGHHGPLGGAACAVMRVLGVDWSRPRLTQGEEVFARIGPESASRVRALAASRGPLLWADGHATIKDPSLAPWL